MRRTGKPHEEILEEAGRGDIDLILMTTHGRTITEPDRLGSIADKVIRGASCSTLVIGSHASVPLRIDLITVPLDGSPLAAEALPVARALAEKLGCKLRLVEAVNHVPYEFDSVASLGTEALEALNLSSSRYLESVRRELDTSAPVETAVLEGPPVAALMADLNEHRPDLVVMSSHGHTGFIRWALGSVTDRMIRGPVPVLVLRPRAESDRPSSLHPA